MPDVRMLWPAPRSEPLSDEELLDAYPMPGGRPLLRVNFVSSVDGAVTLDGRSGTLGGAADRRIFDLLRVGCDAVMVAAGTIRIERYTGMALAGHLRELRRAAGRDEDPVLVVVSRSLGLDPTHPVFAKAPRRPVLVTTETAPYDRFAEVADVIALGRDEVNLAGVVAELARRGLGHILCEGGPHLLGALSAADLVDELCLTVAPKLVGSGPGRIVAGPRSPVRSLALAHVLAAGDELFLRYGRVT